jgi:predicted amidohydrolase
LTSQGTLTVAAVQMTASPRAWEMNTARAAGWIEIAVSAGARLVLLPELFAIGSFYAPDLLAFAEPPQGRTARWLLAAAADYCSVVAGTILERRDGRVHNTLLFAEPDGRLLRYTKRNLGVVEREFGIARGGEPNVLRTALGHVGCLICSDGNNVDLRQTIAQANSDVVLVPQAIGATERLGRLVETMEEGGRQPLWGEIVRELGVPTVTAGLVGIFENPRPEVMGDYLRGGTYIIDAAGCGIAYVPFPEEGVAVATLPLGKRCARP